MIAAVHGQVQAIRSEGRGDAKVHFRCGPVTLELTLPLGMSRELSIGEDCELHTYLHFASQADVLRLYAFTSGLARDLFTMLIGASGIGPAVALNLLDLGAGGLVAAIRDADEKTLTKVSGVGPKLAKKVILELGEKVAKEFSGFGLEGHSMQAAAVGAGRQEASPVEDAIQAVIALGFPRPRAEAALAEVRRDYDGEETVQLIRKMLSRLSG